MIHPLGLEQGKGHGHGASSTFFGISLSFSWLENMSVLFTVPNAVPDLKQALNIYLLGNE